MSVVHTDSHQVGYAGATCGRKYQCFHGKSRETSVPYSWNQVRTLEKLLPVITSLVTGLITYNNCMSRANMQQHSTCKFYKHNNVMLIRQCTSVKTVLFDRKMLWMPRIQIRKLMTSTQEIVSCAVATICHVQPGAFLAAAVWGGQWGGHISIWGGQEFRMT